MHLRVDSLGLAADRSAIEQGLRGLPQSGGAG